MIITVVCVVLTLSFCLAAAFRIVRHTGRAAGAAFRILLLGLAIPIQAIIVPSTCSSTGCTCTTRCSR